MEGFGEALKNLQGIVKRTPTEVDDIILRALTKPISFLIVVIGVGLSSLASELRAR